MPNYPDHFPLGSARLCENCNAVTNAETTCPCCTSTRLVLMLDLLPSQTHAALATTEPTR